MEPDRPGAGAILIGVFLLLFGACLLLAGGGCTILLLLVMTNSASGGASSLGALVVPLLIAGVGILCIWLAAWIMRGPAPDGEAWGDGDE